MEARTSILLNTSAHDTSPAGASDQKGELNHENSDRSNLFVQCKLTVGAVDDPLEREAESTADKIMRMPEHALIQRKCSHCEEEEIKRSPLPFIQRKSENTSDNITSSSSNDINASRGQGNHLDSSTQSFMENRFGTDFSQVKIHTGEKSSQWNQELNAQAFTVGNDIFFNAGKYSPETLEGKHLLAHELTHVVQQSGGIQRTKIQRRFRPTELMPTTGNAPSNPITTTPDTYFFQGSAANTTGRRALVVGGIHRGERSAGNLSREALGQLSARTLTPDFHTLFIIANPIPRSSGYNRSAGSGTTRVNDLNREFGTGYTSANPTANLITEAVNDFDPERVLSIHAISTRTEGGIFLDPIHNRVVSGTGTGVEDDIHSYPATGTSTQRRDAFVGDARNEAAMTLTESMISSTVGTSTAGRVTPGNVSSRNFPASNHPPASATTASVASPYSLIYPEQSSTTTVAARAGTTLGTWASGYNRTVITIEVPGYEAGPAVYRPYLNGIRSFLTFPAATTPVTAPTATTTVAPTGSGGAVQRTLSDSPSPAITTIPSSSNTIRKREDPNKTVTSDRPRETREPTLWDRILELLDRIIAWLRQLVGLSSPSLRDPIPAQLASRCRTFNNLAELDARKAAWQATIASMPVADVVKWITGVNNPPAAAKTESESQKNCLLDAIQLAAGVSSSGIQLPTLLSGQDPHAEWTESGHRNFNNQNRIWQRKFNFTGNPFDRITPAAVAACPSAGLTAGQQWDPGNARHVTCWRGLTAEQKQREILQASSAPGISRHHWGTDFDLFSVEPTEWASGGTGANFADEYTWLQRNAASYGFLQSFTNTSVPTGSQGYMEEKWHWSYYPISQALLDFATGTQGANPIGIDIPMGHVTRI